MANEFIVRKGLIVEGASGGTVVDIQGSQGQLFSVTDDLSGSIFAVSDISGVPIFDVNSSGVSYFDGNVGIGTTAPAAKLQVDGATPVGTTGFGDSANSGQIYITSNAAVGSQLGGRIAFGGIAGNGGGAFSGTRQDSVYGTIEGYKYNSTANNSGGGLSFKTNFNNTGALTERMNIDQAGTVVIGGNVGIGTTNPGRKLTVQGADDGTMQLRLMGTASQTSYWEIGREASSTGQFRFIASRTGTVITPMVIDDQTGNVGIGMTDPDFRLDVSKGYTSGLGKVAKFRSGNDSTFVNFDTVHVVQQDVPCLAIIEAPTGTQADEQKLTFTVGDARAIIGSTSTVTNGMSFYTNRDVDTTGFSSSGNLALHLANSGNVGIGTTNPVTKLEVDRDLQSDTINRANSAAYIRGQDIGLAIGQYASGPYGTWIQSISNTDATFPLTLNGLGGNVGIGTASPDAKLEINDTNKAINTKGNLFVSTTDALAIDKGGQISLGGVWSGTSQIQFAGIAGRKENATSGNAGGYLQLSTTNSAGGNLTERMRIDSTGNVLIGAAANVFSYGGPTLHVGGSRATLALKSTGSLSTFVMSASNSVNTTDIHLNQSGADGSLVFYQYSAGGTTMTLDGAGKLGINTTSPNEKLQVVGNIQGGGVDQASSEFNTNAIFRGQNDGAAYINLIAKDDANSGILLGVSASGVIDSYVAGLLYSNTTNSLNIHVNNQNAIVIDSSQRVGINVSAPTQKLHVVGSARVTGAFYDSSNDPGTAGQILSSTATGTDWIAAPSAGSTVYTPSVFEIKNSAITASQNRAAHMEQTLLITGSTGVTIASGQFVALTASQAGVYEISYTIYLETTNTGNRQIIGAYVERQASGSTPLMLDGSFSSVYMRLGGSNQGGAGTITNTFYAVIADDDVFKFRTCRVDVNTAPVGVSITTPVFPATSGNLVKHTISFRKINAAS